MKNTKPDIREICIFALLGAIMYASKIAMQTLPNIHLVGLFITALTVKYRRKALYPLYLYVLLDGLTGGFALWWIPYLYIWTVLWAAVMLLPKNIPKKIAVPVYCVVTGLHGLLFGVLYAPAQAILHGLSFRAMLAWIAAGFPYDVIHGVSDCVLASLVLPLVALLDKCEKIGSSER